MENKPITVDLAIAILQGWKKEGKGELPLVINDSDYGESEVTEFVLILHYDSETQKTTPAIEIR